MVKLGTAKKCQEINEKWANKGWVREKSNENFQQKNGWCAANCGAQPIIPQNPARVTLIQVDRRALANKIRWTKAIATKKL